MKKIKLSSAPLPVMMPILEQRYIMGVVQIGRTGKHKLRRVVRMRDGWDVRFHLWTQPNKGEALPQCSHFVPLKVITEKQLLSHYEKKN